MSEIHRQVMFAIVNSDGDAAIVRPSRGAAINFRQKMNQERRTEAERNRKTLGIPSTEWDGWRFEIAPRDGPHNVDGEWIVYGVPISDEIEFISRQTGLPIED